MSVPYTGTQFTGSDSPEATPRVLDSSLTPANPSFRQVWERTDKPVADLRTNRTWLWGPGAFTGAITEPYADSPGGYRQVQYFDKARMEINQPNSHAPTEW